jgi:ribA/ribD-fused uncharacterized protein
MINEFKGEYRFLSNFYPAQVVLDGAAYATVEHAYQAAKTADLQWRSKIRSAQSAGDAKKLGNQIPRELFNPKWNDIRLEIMADLLIQKFYDATLRASLLATGDAELIEGNAWGDKFWGVSRGEGTNKLGQLLMVIRQLYRVIQGNDKYETSLKDRLVDASH